MYLTVFREEATSVLVDKHVINIDLWRRKNKQPEKNPGAGQEPTANSTHIGTLYATGLELYLGHIGGRQAPSPLGHTCFLNVTDCYDAIVKFRSNF